MASQLLNSVLELLDPKSSSIAVVTFSGTVLALVVTYGINWFIHKVKSGVIRRKNRRKQEIKRKKCRQGIEVLAKGLRKPELSDKLADQITQAPVEKLVNNVTTGEWTAPDVLKAYQIKALEAHKATNCLIEVFPEAAVWAEECDVSSKERLLAGVPISIKDDVCIKGYDSTEGCAFGIDKPKPDDCVLLKVLKKQGAIPFVKTNLPQLCLSVEPGNPIFGPVGNPHNPTRCPGGSSSGEAALVGFGGSILGFGSDTGGSIRFPCHLCGVTGFKPTVDRISTKGLGKEELFSYSCVSATWGPLARDVSTVVRAMQALWEGAMFDLDPQIPRLPFNIQEYTNKRPLKIGYYYDNKLFTSVPTCRRAVDMAIEHLRAKGHQVLEWLPPNIEYAEDLLFKASAADGGQDIINLLKYEDVDAAIKPIIGVASLPNWLKWLLSEIFQCFDPKSAKKLEDFMGMPNVSDYWAVVREIKEYSFKVTDAWQAAGLDALICPPFPYPAWPLGNPDVGLYGVSYATIYSVVNFPAGVVRMTEVTSEDQLLMKNYPTNDKEHRKVKEMMVGAEGLPVGVQVVALKWQDELCLRVMKEIEGASDLPPIGV